MREVQAALLHYLDMDPAATLGVLFDRITAPQERRSDEKQQHMCKLILALLCGHGLDTVRRYVNNTHEGTMSRRPRGRDSGYAERWLLNKIILAAPGLDNTNRVTIIRTLLMTFPGYTGLTTSQRAYALESTFDKAGTMMFHPPPLPPPPDATDAEKLVCNLLDLPVDTQPIDLWALQDPPGREKPAQTLPNLVKLAIFGSRKKKLTLQEIYRALIDRFDWFKDHDMELSWKVRRPERLWWHPLTDGACVCRTRYGTTSP